MKHILALALMALSIMGQGQERIYIGKDANNIQYYIYPSTIKRSSYGITVWVEQIFTTPRLYKGTKKYYTSRKTQQLIDCDGYRFAIIADIHYSKNGNVVNSTSISEYKAYSNLFPSSPNTGGWHITEETCKRYKRGY